MEKKYWRAKDVSKFLGVSLPTVYNWVHQKSIKHYKVNGTVLLFDPSDISELVKEGEVLCQ